MASGDKLDVGMPVEVFAGDHAIIHRDIPVIPNACYLIGGRLLHPGDSLTVLDRPVEILALPTSAPWMAVKEAIDYFRAVDPKVAIPIHDKLMANPAMVYGLLQRLGPAGRPLARSGRRSLRNPVDASSPHLGSAARVCTMMAVRRAAAV